MPAGEVRLYGQQVRCVSKTYGPPSTWIRQTTTDKIASYDLAIIGGGVASAYLVSEVLKKKPDANIVIFEGSNHFGGRLMSAYGSGSLGPAVSSERLKGQPPPEYGGMRIDPNNHWLVWNAIQEVADATHPGDKPCGRKGPKKVAPVDPNLVSKFPEDVRNLGTEGDCDNYMVKMTTATMRYATGSKADPKMFGSYLLNSTFFDDGVIHDTCLSMIGYAQAYVKDHMSVSDQRRKTLDEAVNEACDNCDKGPAELCGVCAKFPNPGMNLVSCIGYDDLTQVPSAGSLTDAAVVTGQGEFNCDPKKGSTDKCANLYLFKYGAQRFAMDLLSYANKKGAGSAGPIFGKRLSGLNVVGKDTKKIAEERAKKLYDAKDNEASKATSESEMVELKFEDGSVTAAKAVYLTVLPLDLIEIDGFQPYDQALKDATLPFGATKMFIHWNGGLPQPILDATDSGGKRLVTDGNRPGQMARQIFYWDASTILIYQTAPTNDDLPANVMQEEMQTTGMDSMMGGVMDQLQDAFRQELPYPSWARVKSWANGALSYYRSGCGAANCSSLPAFQSILQRPLGQDIPVFYGNSEMSGGGGGTQGTGWVMGSFHQVQLHLDAILGTMDL